MNLHVDTAADRVHLRLADAAVRESEEIEPGIVLDFDAAGQIVGIEILRLSA